MLHFTDSTAVNLTLSLLLLFSLVTWALIFSKGWLQWRMRQENARFVEAFWKAVDLEAAEKVANREVAMGEVGFLARLARTGFETRRQLASQKTLASMGDRQAVMERSLSQQVQKEQHALESGLMLLASIGTTAPFVGLFGTVWGIMSAMENIARSGSAGLEVVAGPVGEALLATAIGIATAVPAVLAYNYGVRVTRLNVAEMDRFAHDFQRLACHTASDKVGD
jgi:biopolymer transport protein ExbB